MRDENIDEDVDVVVYTSKDMNNSDSKDVIIL